MTVLPNSPTQNMVMTTNGTAAIPITVTKSKVSTNGVNNIESSAARNVCPG